MKNFRKTLALFMAAVLLFSTLTFAVTRVGAASADEASETDYLGIAENVFSEIVRFFKAFMSFFESLLRRSTTAETEKKPDLTEDTSVETQEVTDVGYTQDEECFVLTRNVELSEFSISTAVDIDLNGYTLTCESFTYNTDVQCEVAIRNGAVIARSGNIDIIAPEATLTLGDVSLNVIDESTQSITIDASLNTVILDSGFSASAVCSMLDETKVVTSPELDEPVSIAVTGNGVTVENNSMIAGNSIVVKDNVTSDVEIINNGALDSIEVQSGDLVRSTFVQATVSYPVTITNNGTLGMLTNETHTAVMLNGTQPSETAGNIISPWDGVTYTEVTIGDGDIYSISNAAQLAWVSRQTNAGLLKGGRYVLTSNIDLNSKEWTPIGSPSKKFTGTFDGNGYTIYNLLITGGTENTVANNNAGLFGVAQKAVINNFTLNTVNVSGGMFISAVLGNGTGNTISNVNLTGEAEISAWWYCGAILGYGASEVKNCNVYVSTDSYVKVVDSYAGGIIGYSGEGKRTIIDSCSSNINVTGCYSGIGGLVGFLNYGNIVSNSSCSAIVTNVVPEPAESAPTGGICGAYYCYGRYITKIDSCSFTGTLMYHDEIHENNETHPFYGSSYGSGSENLVIV